MQNKILSKPNFNINLQKENTLNIVTNVEKDVEKEIFQSLEQVIKSSEDFQRLKELIKINQKVQRVRGLTTKSK